MMFGVPSCDDVARPDDRVGAEPVHPAPDPEAHDRAVDRDAQRGVARGADPLRHVVEGLVRVQLADPRRRGRRGGDLRVGERADLRHDRGGAARGVRAGHRQVAVGGEQAVAAERGGQHREGERDAEHLGAGVGRGDAAHRARPDHPAGERLAVRAQRLLGARAAFQVAGDLGRQGAQRRGMDLLECPEVGVRWVCRRARHACTLLRVGVWAGAWPGEKAEVTALVRLGDVLAVQGAVAPAVPHLRGCPGWPGEPPPYVPEHPVKERGRGHRG